MLRAPRSLMGPVPEGDLQQSVAGSPLTAKYGQPVDRESAYERLAARLAPPSVAADAPVERRPAPRRRPPEREPEPSGGVVADVLGSAAFRSFTRSAASALGREITRGLFGTRRRRR
ncbi:helicase HerA-like domain-containing protein [Modestobacter roseus]|uniref:helicase HerA-like domain-containing protein n=1 Tax=Modestobacter roseus TaxID=1181884 RepID=UPI00225E581F|nr:helicase HerA-like domain-containing protein [Modestobacter roseus]